MATPAQSTMYNEKSKTPTGFVEYKAPQDGPVFKHYQDYVVATEKEAKPSSSYNASTTTRTGFLEFKPRDMASQRKYDAMSPEWEGMESSDAAIAKGVYDLDKAEANRQELRKLPTPVMPVMQEQIPKTTFLDLLAKPVPNEGTVPDGNCIVQ
jgi:hypothetical protein